MSLSQQFQIIIFSFLFGILFLASYDLFNRIFYRIKGKFVRFVLELIFFSILSGLYFLVLFLINDAVLTIYLPLLIILGALFYIKFLSFPLLRLYEIMIQWVKKKLFPYNQKMKKNLKKLKDVLSKIKQKCFTKLKRKKSIKKETDMK
ncbi:putative uncharacterized protein [Firmicutes bacterium CAG:631]|nr:putative uncharacterized protein [Firmicutes bacterium CAG:631]